MCISKLILKNCLKREMLRMALASNLRSRDGGSKVFMMKFSKDFDKVNFSTNFIEPQKG